MKIVCTVAHAWITYLIPGGQTYAEGAIQDSSLQQPFPEPDLFLSLLPDAEVGWGGIPS